MAVGGNPGDGGIGDRLAELSKTADQGGDVLAAAQQTTTAELDPVDSPERAGGIVAPVQEGEEPEPPPNTELSDEKAAEAAAALDAIFDDADPYQTREGDPEGTYRSGSGQLRDKATHRILSEAKDPAAPDEGPAGEPPAEAPATDKLTVELPPRSDDQEPIAFVAPNEEVAAAIRRIQKNGMRNDEFNRRMGNVESKEADLRAVEEELQSNPTDFLVRRIPEEVQINVVQRLVARLKPEAFARVVEQVDEWRSDAGSREVYDTKEENRMLREGDARRKATDTNKARSQRSREIAETIGGLIPEEWPQQRRALAHGSLQNALVQYIHSNELSDLQADEIPEILEKVGALELLGITASSRGGTPRGRADSPAAGPVPEAREVGEALKARNDRRKAAVVSSGGTGAAGGQIKPSGLGVEEALDWFAGLGSK